MTSFKLCYKFLSIAISVAYVSSQHLEPCKLNDDACVLKSGKSAYAQLVEQGSPSLGIEPADPLHVDVVEGNLSVLKYTFTDSTVTGLKNCEVTDIKLNIDKMTFGTDLICPNLEWVGNYVISGRLIILPIEGNGTYHMHADKYHIGVDTELIKVAGKDGQEHLNIKTFKLNIEAMEKIIFRFENLFDGRKDLSETIHMFANENWKDVSDFTQGPAFNSIFKKLISRLNKYLKSIPYQDLFLN